MEVGDRVSVEGKVTAVIKKEDGTYCRVRFYGGMWGDVDLPEQLVKRLVEGK